MEIVSFFTTPGLVKKINEDIIARSGNEFCICDGHWGIQAALLTCKTLINKFPGSYSQALIKLHSIEKILFQNFPGVNPPETSVLNVKIFPQKLKLTYLSYGDCRLFVCRNRQIVFRLKTQPTWLGGLSYQLKRSRLSVKDGLLFGQLQLQTNDLIYLFTDGVDECIYEKPAIPWGWLAKHNASDIINRIFKHGAQDNASLVIIKC